VTRVTRHSVEKQRPNKQRPARQRLAKQRLAKDRSYKFWLAGAVVALAPALAGCEAGLNAPTLDFHPAAFGAYASSADGITISNAFVLGAGVNQSLPKGGQAGMFLSLSSASNDKLEKVTAKGAASVKLKGGAINIAANTPVNLTGPAPRLVLTDLSAAVTGGTTISVTLDFATAGDITINVPVEPHAYDYATYAQPAAPTPTTTALSVTRKKHHPRISDTTTPQPSTSASSLESPVPTATPSPTS
jgi:copper(I)-binding protein